MILKFAKSSNLYSLYRWNQKDDSFPDSQFKINGYQFAFLRRYRGNRGGEEIVFIMQGWS